MDLLKHALLFNFSDIHAPSADLLFHKVLFLDGNYLMKRFMDFLKHDKYFVLCIITFFIWTVFNVMYELIAKTLFTKLTRKTAIDSARFVDTLWNICFYGMSIPFGILTLEPGKSFEENLNNGTMENRENHFAKCQMKNNTFVDTTLYIALITGFYIHCAFDALNKGKRWPEVILKILFCACVLIAFDLRNAQFIITLITAVGVPRFVDELSKLLFNFGGFSNSVYLKYSSYLFLIIHSMTWIHIYLMVLPNILNYKNKYLVEYVVFTILLCVLYGLELLTCPISRVFLSLFLNKPFGLEYYLYGTNLFNKSRHLLRREMIEANREMHQESETPTNYGHADGNPATKYKRSEHSITVYQTIICYMRMKRKLKSIRKRIEERNKAAALEEELSLHKEESDS